MSKKPYKVLHGGIQIPHEYGYKRLEAGKKIKLDPDHSLTQVLCRNKVIEPIQETKAAKPKGKKK